MSNGYKKIESYQCLIFSILIVIIGSFTFKKKGTLKPLLTTLLFLCLSVIFAQNETNNWYFGANAGMSFSTGAPTPLLDGALSTAEGCATISDSNGNLLFYTDGVTVYNRNHVIMLNGSGLNGNFSSTHSGIIIPKPSAAGFYYVVTVDAEAGVNGLQYSEVDMSLDSGLGGITGVKNVPLHTPTLEKVTVIKNAGSDEYWILSHKWNSDEFICFKVDMNGINPNPVISSTGAIIGSPTLTGRDDQTKGQIKFSPNGTKVAVAHSKNLNEVQLFDFDAQTGVLSNGEIVFSGPLTNDVYGVEFSPNSELLYIGILGEGIYQLDLTPPPGLPIFFTMLAVNTVPAPYGSLQLAKDGKIYVALSSRPHLDVINNPNVQGAGCNYQQAGFLLNGRQSRLGLPTFIQSFLFIEDIQFVDVCLGDTTQFNLTNPFDSVFWDFGDAASGANNNSTLSTPTHVFTAAGTYTVTATVTFNGLTASRTSVVEIFEKPTATQPQDILLCDADNDGFEPFDLTSLDNAILNGLSFTDFEVAYFASLSDYNNDTPITNPSTFVTALPFTIQTIIASARNRRNATCNSITSFQITISESPFPVANIPVLTLCDNTSIGTDNDGIVLFNLTQYENTILNGQASSDFELLYFTDAALSSAILNPAAYQNSTVSETIYVQMINRNNNECAAVTSFQIEVLPLPMINMVVELAQCDDDLDGISSFNLNEAISEITNASSVAITFYTNNTDAVNGSNPILNPTTFQNNIPNLQTIYATVVSANGCARVAQINLRVVTTQIPSSFSEIIFKCDDGVNLYDGIATFDLTASRNAVRSLFPTGQSLDIQFFTNEVDALTESNPILNIGSYQNSTSPGSQAIYVRVDNATNDCIGLGQHITLQVESNPLNVAPILIEQCDANNDGVESIDTTSLNAQLLQGQTGVELIFRDSSGALLPSPLPNPFTTSTQDINVELINRNAQNPLNDCSVFTTVSFLIDAGVFASAVPDLVACDDDNDGLYSFDTTNIESSILGTQTGLLVTYRNFTGTLLPSPLPNPFITGSQQIIATVTNPINGLCFAESTITFKVNPSPELLMDEEWTICDGDTVTLAADPGYDTYLWSTGETSDSITVRSPGNYRVTVGYIYGNTSCEESKELVVRTSSIAVIRNVAINDWSQNNNSIAIQAAGTGYYEYSLAGIIYQDSAIFENVPAGQYRVHVRDKNGCGVVSEDVYLLFYPNYFTPNGDGYHDFWQIYNADKEPNIVIHIYDRYGKLLKQIDGSGNGWDGTYNGNPLPSNDYWFSVTRENGKIYKGHFTLKR